MRRAPTVQDSLEAVGESQGSGGAEVPALKWREMGHVPWDGRTPRNGLSRPDSGGTSASSASQRDALLSARRVHHLQRRQEGACSCAWRM